MNRALYAPAPTGFSLKLTDVWHWGALFTIIATSFLSMYLSNSLPLMLVAFPIMILDRSFIVPVMLLIAATEGAYRTETETSQTESILLMAMVPIFLYDYSQKLGRNIIPAKITLLFVIFLLFVITGLFVYLSHPEIAQFFVSSEKKSQYVIYYKNAIKCVKLITFFLLIAVLVGYDKALVRKTLQTMLDIAPYIIIIIAMNMLLFGRVADKYETIHFGEAKHGDFTSNTDCIGILVYMGLLGKGSSLFRRFISFIALGCLVFIIMSVASRNGLLCLILITGITTLVALKNQSMTIKALLFGSGFAVLVVAGIALKDSPTILRFTAQTEAGGGDRLSYWYAGVEGVVESPFFGLGGDESASVYACSKYSPEVEDHVMHNTFLEFMVEYGLFGFAFYLIFVGTLLYHAYRNLRYALAVDDILLAYPGIAYFISIFAGLFISRIWESTLWYYTILVFAVYLVWRKPVDDALKNRKAHLIHGLPDPIMDPKLAANPQ